MVVYATTPRRIASIAARAVAATPRPFAFHLFFKDHGRAVRRWRLLDADSTKPNVNQSVTIVTG